LVFATPALLDACCGSVRRQLLNSCLIQAENLPYPRLIVSRPCCGNILQYVSEMAL